MQIPFSLLFDGLEAAPACCFSFLPFSSHPKFPKGSDSLIKADETDDPEATALLEVGVGRGILACGTEHNPGKKQVHLWPISMNK